MHLTTIILKRKTDFLELLEQIRREPDQKCCNSVLSAGYSIAEDVWIVDYAHVLEMVKVVFKILVLQIHTGIIK